MQQMEVTVGLELLGETVEEIGWGGLDVNLMAERAAAVDKSLTTGTPEDLMLE